MRLTLAMAGIGLTAFSLTSASAAPFTDIAASPEHDAIVELTDRGIVGGYEDGTFRPDQLINRAEYLKILMDTRFSKAGPPDDLRCFNDLEVKTPQWYARPVCLARALGIVSGYPDGLFRPGKPLNLAEALTMALRAFGIPLPAKGGGLWYEPSLSAARQRGILLPLLKTPAHFLTRGEMAVLTIALLHEAEATASGSLTTHAAVCGNGVREDPEQCDDGNTVDGDGCSSICIIVPEPVRRAFLQIDQQTTGTVTTIAQGQQDLTLLKFTATAGRQDVLMTSLAFAPSIGSLAYGQHYRLAMDRDGDGKYEQIVRADGRADAGTLVFDHFTDGSVLLKKGLTVPFVVTADLAESLGPVTIGLTFALALPEYVTAQGATDGLALTGIETNNVCTADTCFIRVNTEASTDVNISERGNLFVMEDTVPVRSHLLLGGTVSAPLLRLKLRAEGENIDVRTIRLDGVASSVDALLLYIVPAGQSFDLAHLQPFAQATNGQCPSEWPAGRAGPTEVQTRFCASMSLSTLIVTPEQEVTIAVAAKLKSEELGAVSGENFRLSLSPALLPSPAIEARGTSSLLTLAQNNGDGRGDGEIFIGTSLPGPSSQIVGPMNDTALATIAAIANSGSAEEPFIPVGQTTIGSFKLSAAPHDNSFHGTNDVVLKTLVFRVTAQNVQVDPLGFRLRSTDAGTTMPCTATETTGTITVTCSSIDQQEFPSHIQQGSSATYALDANVTNTEIVPGSSVLFVTLPTLGQRTEVNSVVWSDESTTFSWVDIPETSVDSTVYRTRGH